MATHPHSASPGRCRVCLGQISGAHGVRGLVKVRSFTEAPDGVAAYGPLTDQAGQRTFTLTLLSRHKGQWLAHIDGVADRDAAASLAGTRLYVARNQLPPPDVDEFYQADLIGMRAEGLEGAVIGRVTAIHDFGAGDVLELARADAGTGMVTETMLLPFTRSVVPVIDLAAGRLVVVLPIESPPDGSGANEQKRHGPRH